MSEQSPPRGVPTTPTATVAPIQPTSRTRRSKAATAPTRAKKTAVKGSSTSEPGTKPAPSAVTAASTKAAPRKGGSLAAGAARASGERRRRTGTPLLARPAQPVTTPEAGQPATVLPPGQSAPDEAAATGRQRRTVRRPTADASGEPASGPRLDAPSTVPPSASGDAPEPDSSAAPQAGSRPSRSAISEARARRSRRLAATADGGTARLRSVPTPVPTSAPASSSQGLVDPGDNETDPGFTTEFSTEFTTDFSADEAGAGAATTAGEGPEEGGGIAAVLQSGAEKLVAKTLESTVLSSGARPGPRELVELAVNVLRAAAVSAGLPTEQVEAQVAEGLAYLRRRLTGDFTVDEFGFDEDYTLGVHLPALRPFYRKWFRVETRGIENIPDTGGALLVANHSGTVAFDSLMTQVAVHDEHPKARHLRMLGADLVFSTPFVGTMARRSGTTLAANSNAQRLLSGGQLVGVWPEGFKGVGKPFTERYKLQRFGRGGFVAAALRAGVPIVPVSIVGAEEIYPILGDVPALARLLGMPYAPITATWPLLGPLGLIPLPSKWLIEFGQPIDTSAYGPEAAEDPMLVFDLTDQVRETIQQTLYSLLMQRRSVFF